MVGKRTGFTRVTLITPIAAPCSSGALQQASKAARPRYFAPRKSADAFRCPEFARPLHCAGPENREHPHRGPREQSFQSLVSGFTRRKGRQMNTCRRQTDTPRSRSRRSAGWRLATMASNTGCTSSGELAMTFNISAVAACCSRASFRSLLGPETERRLTRVAAGAMRALGLGGLAALCWACVAGFRLARLAARS